jgi:hypothetical protein
MQPRQTDKQLNLLVCVCQGKKQKHSYFESLHTAGGHCYHENITFVDHINIRSSCYAQVHIHAGGGASCRMGSVWLGKSFLPQAKLAPGEAPVCLPVCLSVGLSVCQLRRAAQVQLKAGTTSMPASLASTLGTTTLSMMI